MVATDQSFSSTSGYSTSNGHRYDYIPDNQNDLPRAPPTPLLVPDSDKKLIPTLTPVYLLQVT